MRDQLKYVIKILMRFILRLYWIIPIDRNRVFFMSTMGKNYSCNPKYIYLSMQSDKRFENYRYVWAFNTPENVSDQFVGKRNTAIVSRKNLLMYFYYLLSSGIVIYNCGGFSYAPMRKKQMLIETWHGGGAYKKVGISVENKTKASKAGIQIASNEIKLFLVSSEIWKEQFVVSSMNYHGKILECGMPRNDIFWTATDDEKKRLRKKLYGNTECKIILYAPTFKGNEYSAYNINYAYQKIDVLNVKESCKKRFGGEWKFYTRGHQYADKISLDWTDGDLTDYSDMQEILLVTDVLITDYSSSMWDFALSKKPCFLYVPDMDEYKNNERGFCTPIETWPGLVSMTNDMLAENILRFSQKTYSQKIDKYFDSAISYERGTACMQVKDYILKNNK